MMHGMQLTIHTINCDDTRQSTLTTVISFKNEIFYNLENSAMKLGDNPEVLGCYPLKSKQVCCINLIYTCHLHNPQSTNLISQ